MRTCTPSYHVIYSVFYLQRFNAYNESLEETRCTEIRKNCAFNFPVCTSLHLLEHVMLGSE